MIKKLIEYIEGTKDFILEQAPDIIQQILEYDTKSTILWLCLACIVALCGAALCVHGYFSTQSTFEKPYLIFAYMLTPFAIIAIFACCDNLIKIKIAPKYYVLEKIIKIGEKK